MRRFGFLIILLVLTSLLSSCFQDTVFEQYVHTPIAGWEKNDTLSFEIPPLQSGGSYREHLGLRITGAYPFMGLTLVVEQTIYPDPSKKWQKTLRTDTIQCDLIDKNGVTKGQGVSYYQYDFPINEYSMCPGDSIHLTVRHDMKREILPGISDIGLKVERVRE